MIRQHEIIKIVADLQENGELELAHRIAGQFLRTSHSVSKKRLISG